MFFFASRRRHTRYIGDWSSDVCSSDLFDVEAEPSIAVRGPHFLRRFPAPDIHLSPDYGIALRSEERRVGKECRSGWSSAHEDDELSVAGYTEVTIEYRVAVLSDENADS